MPDMKPGSRFASNVCTTEVIVVKGVGEADLRCGGSPMLPPGSVPDGGTPDPEAAVGRERGSPGPVAVSSRSTGHFFFLFLCSNK